MAFHPADDRFPDTQPVLGHVVEFEAGSAVLDEDFGAAVRDLKVHRDGPAAVPGGVQHGLTAGLDQRLVALRSWLCPPR